MVGRKLILLDIDGPLGDPTKLFYMVAKRFENHPELGNLAREIMDLIVALRKNKEYFSKIPERDPWEKAGFEIASWGEKHRRAAEIAERLLSHEDFNRRYREALKKHWKEYEDKLQEALEQLGKKGDIVLFTNIPVSVARTVAEELQRMGVQNIKDIFGVTPEDGNDWLEFFKDRLVQKVLERYGSDYDEIIHITDTDRPLSDVVKEKRYRYIGETYIHNLREKVREV